VSRLAWEQAPGPAPSEGLLAEASWHLSRRARAASADVELALLLFDDSRYPEAERAVRRAVDLQERVGVSSADGQAVLARILVATGRIAAAQAALAQGSRAGSGATVETAAAEIELATRAPDRAIARLERLLRDTIPWVTDRFEAELVLARAEQAAGRSRAARARRRDLVAQARAKGFALLVRRASH
jgi:hypothetical protein